MPDASPQPLSLSYTGVLFAGGRSSRMGRNKALLPVAGIPLWTRQYALLEQAGATGRVVSVRAGEAWLPPEISRVTDDGSQGPFGGLLAALRSCSSSTTHLIALAVDLPQLPAVWFGRLRSHCGGSRGAVGHNPRLNAFEPLAAIYPRELLPLAEEAAAAGSFCLQSLLGRAVAAGLLQVETILPADEPWFANWNSPSDVVEL